MNMSKNSQKQGLIDFYTRGGHQTMNSGNGHRWKRKKNWLTNKPLDEWYGVSLDRHGDIVSLQLPDNNMQGI
jgi:hypothetical protein